jgi:hypothetical protein
LARKYFENLPDGNYTYELQLAPVISAAQREALQKARAKDDDPENERAARKRSVMSGAGTIRFVRRGQRLDHHTGSL